ncbi:MAG: hypothetical protein GYA17_16590, partial [Chloroflexi bacterium]|nr:hypothetical protein [Chloroflexota bacterium]
EKALSPRPEDRFESVQAFGAALTGAASQPTQPVTAPAQAGQPRRPFYRSPGCLLAGVGAALGLVAVLAVAGGLFWLNGRPTPTVLAPEPTPALAVLDIATPTPSRPQATPTLAPPTATLTAAPSDTPLPVASPTPQLRLIGEGKRIVFVSDRAGGQTLQLWSMAVALDELGNVVPVDVQQLTFDPMDKYQPAWSPDGTALIYSATGPQGQDRDLWLLDLSAPQQKPVPLVQLKGDDSQPAWSPDGEWIAFTNHGRFNPVDQLYVVPAAGGEPHRLSFDFEESSPVWSPAMDWMLYVIAARDHRYFFLRSWGGDVYPTPFPTPQPYDPTTYFGRLGEVSGPAWSPDGAFIAYTRHEGSLEKIYSLRYASLGGETTLLTGDTSTNREPDWSPDSQWIVFTSARDGNSEIYLMTATGLLQTNLSQSPGNDSQPAWQP